MDSPGVQMAPCKFGASGLCAPHGLGSTVQPDASKAGTMFVERTWNASTSSPVAQDETIPFTSSIGFPVFARARFRTSIQEARETAVCEVVCGEH